MKELIYLDTNFLNSFIAQKEGGLPETKSYEAHDQEGKIQGNTQAIDSGHKLGVDGKSGNINVKGIFESPSGGANYVYNRGTVTTENVQMSELEAAKEIVSKKLHDNALADFESYLDEKNILKNILAFEDGVSNGSFIKIKSSFRLIDIEFLKNAFGQTLVDVMDAANKQEIEEKINGIDLTDLNKGQKGSEKRRLQKENEREQNGIKNNFAMVQEIFNYLSTVLPSDTLIKMGHFVAPLKIRFLRENADELNFKYGADNPEINITLLGKVSRRFENLVDPNIIAEETGAFEQVVDSMNEAIQHIFDLTNLIESGDYIVSPVAIYFEEDDVF
jgi:hypothetical protein